MTFTEVLLQQLITGLSNGMIIALIALGYTMVYGIVELINFAHGDLFMLGTFFALTLIAALGIPAPTEGSSFIVLLALLVATPIFCGVINWAINRLAYKPIRGSSRLAPLVSAIGVSFILMNFGLFWGGIPIKEFNFGRSAAAPKDFPSFLAVDNLLGDNLLYISMREVFVFAVTLPLLLALTFLVKRTNVGKAMRVVALNPTAASLMGINVERIISFTFILGGMLAGVASVIYATYNGTIHFQSGFRVGMDAFTAAVLGGIGNLQGAVLGGVLIGLVRATSDQYIATEWTNSVVFIILFVVLLIRPSGLLGANIREKV